MKKLTVAASIIIASIGLTSTASADVFDLHEQNLVKVCEAMVSDKPIRLHIAMKRARITHKQIKEGLVCNGQDAISFALSKNALVTAGIVADKTDTDLDSMVAKL